MVFNRFKLNIVGDNVSVRSMRKKVKDKIVDVLSNNGFVVDPQFESQPIKMSVFILTKDKGKERTYEEYFLSVHASKEDGISLAVSYIGDTKFVLMDSLDSDVISVNSYIRFIDGHFVKSTQDKQVALNKFVKINSPIAQSYYTYKERYIKIKRFIERISILDYDFFTIDTEFDTVPRQNIKICDLHDTLLFKENVADSFSFEGLSMYGPYKLPPEPRKFLIIASNFVYKDRVSHYFEQFSDFKHYFGFDYLEYPGFVIDKELDCITDDIKSKISNDAYVVGIVDNQDLTSSLKYYLLSNNIPFVFFNSNFVMNDGFYISMPEICLSTLPKLGGIPFLLNTSDVTSAVCGIKIYKGRDNSKYLATVTFNGRGELLNVFVAKGDDESNVGRLVSVLKKINADRYFFHMGDYVTYMRNISLYHDEFRKLKKPYAITAFDTIHPYMDIAFDISDKKVYMPMNGTYIKAGADKYLLFNNVKLTQTTLLGLRNEYPPIAIRNFVYKNSISEEDIIEKIFQFSYLNYRSFKKQLLPATVYYARKLMEEITFLYLPLPNTDIARKSLWFI